MSLQRPAARLFSTAVFLLLFIWQRGEYIELVRNSHYWKKDLPYLDGITYRIIPDVTSRRVAEYIRLQLAKVGITVNLEAADTATWVRRMAKCKKSWSKTCRSFGFLVKTITPFLTAASEMPTPLHWSQPVLMRGRGWRRNDTEHFP